MRIRFSGQIARVQTAQPAPRVQSALVNFFDFNADLAQFADDPIAMFRIAVFDFQLAFGDGGGHHEGPGFDSIRNDRVLGAVQTLNAFDLNSRRAGAAHPRPHFVQQFSEILYLWLARGVVNRRAARAPAWRPSSDSQCR